MNNNMKFCLGKDLLGIDLGISKEEVSNMITDNYYHTDTTCFICGNTASHRLIAKDPKYNTVQIQDKGYVCSYCLQHNPNIDKAKYGIRPLK